jgi:hypothetical protein
LSWNFLSASCMFWLTMCGSISEILMKEFLLSWCFCGLRWVPWYSLSVLGWSLDLGICFLHFALNPLLLYFGGKIVSIPFSSSHIYTWFCFCPWTMCNLVLAGLHY